MQRTIEYKVGAEIYAQPLFNNAAGSTLVIVAVGDNNAFAVDKENVNDPNATQYEINTKSHCHASGYQQNVYSSEEEYLRERAESKEIIKLSNEAGNFDYSKLSGSQLAEILAIMRGTEYIRSTDEDDHAEKYLAAVSREWLKPLSRTVSQLTRIIEICKRSNQI